MVLAFFIVYTHRFAVKFIDAIFMLYRVYSIYAILIVTWKR